MYLRLFIAINLAAETKNSLGRFIEELRPHAVRGRFTSIDNLHLTLAFIGETDRISSLIAAMDKLDAPSFSMAFTKLGRFSRPGGDTYWLGVQGAGLTTVHSQLEAALGQEGFPIDKRPFRPHLTLGRGLAFAQKFDPNAVILDPLTGERVKGISLMQTLQTGRGVIYAEKYRHRLQEERR